MDGKTDYMSEKGNSGYRDGIIEIYKALQSEELADSENWPRGADLASKGVRILREHRKEISGDPELDEIGQYIEQEFSRYFRGERSTPILRRRMLKPLTEFFSS